MTVLAILDLTFLDWKLGPSPLRDWLVALGVALAVALALRLARTLLERRIEPLVERARFEYADALVETLQDTGWLFYLAIGAWTGSRFLDLPEKVAPWLRGAVVVVALFQVGRWGHGFVRRAVERWAGARAEGDEGPRHERQTMAAAVSFLFRLAIWATVLLLVLANLGVEISGLIAGLGIGGVAAALAVQNVLGDLFSSLSLYFDRPFDLGDFVIVDDFMGTVDRIGMRSTRLTSLGGEQLVFANSDLAKSRIRNYKRMEERRIVTGIGVVYGTPHEKVRQVPAILREAVEATEGTRFDRAHFHRFGAYSLDFELVWWVLSKEYDEFMERQQAILLHVHRRFEEEDIDFAFPTQTVQVEGQVPLEAGEGMRSMLREGLRADAAE